MRSCLLIFFIFIRVLVANGQFHEIGAFIGGSNYIGDVGTRNYIHPNNLAYGLLYKWNVTTRYSFRVGVTFTKLDEKEFYTDDINRFRRSYKVENPLQEAVIGAEINFIEFNLHQERFRVSPYVFYGVSYFRYEQFYLTPNGPNSPPTYNSYGTTQKMGFPIILGVKFTPNPLWVIGLEMGARYTLTDNLDGSNPENQFSNNPGYQFGNIGNKDWYVFTGLTISFTFGDLPCYCKEK
ncbi:MAG: hypothetical protein HOH81_04275 [Flavobacteriaceae bacterium]|jgi:hypothetical protein|nr:hypothetical protein [Flavobacteriaceae bacterium]